jgi:hypothetical protein
MVAAFPVGRFSRCLRVTTEIAPVTGGTATTHRARSFCGTRTAWYAPGSGLVKLRHTDQHDWTWSIHLQEHAGPENLEYFPCEMGHRWRYQWTLGGSPEALFQDICRVVARTDDTTWFSSATWAVERSREEQLALARRLGDRTRIAETMVVLAGHLLRNGAPVESAEFSEEAAALQFAAGDTDRGVGCISQAEKAWETARWPPVPGERAYLTGCGRLMALEDGRLEAVGSSRLCLQDEPFPPVPLATPMTDFLWHHPYAGIGLLGADVGATGERGIGSGVDGLRTASVVTGKDAVVSGPWDSFDHCLQIDTSFVTRVDVVQGAFPVPTEDSC